MSGFETHIYLIEPIDHEQFKTKIVFSDSPEYARIAASTAHNLIKIIMPKESEFEIDQVYMDENLSLCIQIDPEILESNERMVKLKYNEKIYHLFKDEAEDVL